MVPTLTSFPSRTFLTSSMSCQMSEQLALARFLIVLAVLAVGLASTSTGEEVKAPAAATLEPRLVPSEFITATGLWSTSTISTVKVEAIEPDEEAPVLRFGT
jgi:hypothetical protein